MFHSINSIGDWWFKMIYDSSYSTGKDFVLMIYIGKFQHLLHFCFCQVFLPHVNHNYNLYHILNISKVDRGRSDDVGGGLREVCPTNFEMIPSAKVKVCIFWKWVCKLFQIICKILAPARGRSDNLRGGGNFTDIYFNHY